MSVLEILMRGMAAGALLAVALGILATRPNGSPAWTAAVFCTSAAAFAVHSQGAETQALGVLQPMVWLLSAGGAGWFWLFAVSLFEDRPFHWTLGGIRRQVIVPPFAPTHRWTGADPAERLGDQLQLRRRRAAERVGAQRDPAQRRVQPELCLQPRRPDYRPEPDRRPVCLDRPADQHQQLHPRPAEPRRRDRGGLGL